MNLSDDEYNDHVARLRKAIDSAPSSSYSHIAHAGPMQRYTPERHAAQEAILDDAWAELGGDDIPKGRQGLILGGTPGSGKTTVRDSAQVPEVGPVKTHFLPIDADYFKGKLIDAGLAPSLPGFSPMEAAPLMHQESNDMAKRFARRAYDQGTNLAWDYTLRHSGSGPHRLEEFGRFGYTPHGIYVHATPEDSLARVQKRHRDDLGQYMEGLHRHGGRYVPPEIITDSVNGGRIANRDNYDAIASRLATSQVFDTSHKTAARFHDPDPYNYHWHPEPEDDGKVTLYHRTQPDRAESIMSSQSLHPDDDDEPVWFATSPEGRTPDYADTYGSSVLEVRVPADKVSWANTPATQPGDPLHAAVYPEYLKGLPISRHGRRADRTWNQYLAWVNRLAMATHMDAYDDYEIPKPYDDPYQFSGVPGPAEWLHASPHRLEPGTKLTPRGGSSPYQDLYDGQDESNRPNWVWMENNPEKARGWVDDMAKGGRQSYLYRVNPDHAPYPWNGSDDEGWVASGATIIGPHTASRRLAMPAPLPEGITFRYHDGSDPEALRRAHKGSEYGRQHIEYDPPVITAHQGDDPRAIAHISWHAAGQPAVEDGTWKHGEVRFVWVDEAHRRSNLANTLFDHARNTDPAVHHSDMQTPLGKQWVRQERSRTAAVTQDLVDRIKGEFDEWAVDYAGPSEDLYGDQYNRGPIGEWKNVENFLYDRYPAAHKNHDYGQEEAAWALDGHQPMPYQLHNQGEDYGADLTPYETGNEAVATHGYDPAEIAATMVLLHNQSHPLRGYLAQEDQNRLTDIYTKRTKMQQDYEKAQPQDPDQMKLWPSPQKVTAAAALLRMAGFDPDEVTKKLHGEFYDWVDQQSEDRYSDHEWNLGVGHWPAVEDFLKDKYPAAHRGFYNGQEDAANFLDDPEEYTPFSIHDDGDSGGESEPYSSADHQKLGYDPQEVAAGMVLLHNQAHGNRDSYINRDKSRLVDIYNKRQQMQRDYEQRQVTAEFSSQPLNVTDDYSMADFFQWCAHNHKKPTQDSLAEFAALSGMDVENYIDIYLFLADGR